MCEQTEVEYLDGDVVWVKLGSCWWPGEVVGNEKLPPDLLPSFKKPPIAVVKFFQEETYEYVKNANLIYKYDCSRKNEFISKGLYMYRTKHGLMEKFPEDVIRAETKIGGDVEILTREEFQEQKKESYAGLFGNSSKKTPASAKKGKGKDSSSAQSTPINKFLSKKTDYKVHILVQPSKETPTKEVSSEAKDSEKEKDGASTPSTSRAGSEGADDKPQKAKPPAVSTPTMSSSGTYSCPNCTFTTSRLNVLILHNKTHSVSYMPYTPSPVRKKTAHKSPSSKSTPKTSKLPKTPRPRKEKVDKEKVPKKLSKSKKRPADEKPELEVKKTKTDEEIKSSLLADWDDDADEDSPDETSLVTGSPELPVGPESPAAPTSAELPSAPTSAELPSAEKPSEALVSPEKKSSDSSADKPESSDSKYEFCEDEDWPVEADGGRKIPRVKNPSKRKEETKSLSLDEDDVAREVAELLNKTAVPELPSVPEPLKVEENFPEPSIVKSPDKKSENISEPTKSAESSVPEARPTKAIFKTKTFFRSRHSRSQDAIGKYVAEQLNPDRIEMADHELNGSEAASSPEARESPPVDHVKVARLAPKIQLKKQLEQERNRLEALEETKMNNQEHKVDNIEFNLPTKYTQDVIYPTQEIKPINKETPEKIHHRELHKEPRNEFKITNEIQNVFQTDIVSNVDNLKLSNIDDLLKTPVEEDFQMSKTVNVSTVSKETEMQPEKLIHETIVEDKSTFSMDYIPKKLNWNRREKTELTTIVSNAELERPVESSLIVESTVAPIEVNTGGPTTTEELHATPPKKSKITEVIMASLKKSETIISPNKTEAITLPEKTEALTSPTKSVEVISSPKKSAAIIISPKKSPNTSISVKTSTTTSALQKTYEQLMQPFMSESTASAVDALLSVSREADRVPKIVSSGPPEDLFEDDKTETNNDELMQIDALNNDDYQMQVTEPVEETVVDTNLNGITEDIVHEESVETCIEQSVETCIEQSVETCFEQSVETCIEQSVETGIEQSVEKTAPENNADSPKEDRVDQTQTPSVIENAPSESDLQIAETLLILPSTAIQNKVSEAQENFVVPMNVDNQPSEEIVPNNEVIVEDSKNEIKGDGSNDEICLENNKNVNIRYDTEQEESENYNAAQSLVQMSEAVDHQMNAVNNQVESVSDGKQEKITSKLSIKSNESDMATSVEQKMETLLAESNCDPSNGINKSPKFETTSKLLKILEEPPTLKPPLLNRMKHTSPVKMVVTGKEKILNFDVAKSPKSNVVPPKQKIIIRRAGSSSTKTIINSLNTIGDAVASPDKIILSRTSKPGQDGSSIQTFTIQAPPESTSTSDTKHLIIQPKVKKVMKTKVQKLKPHNSLVNWPETHKSSVETPAVDDAMFDINSMPVVLSEDILTPESIDKMPIVMSDGNLIPPNSRPPQPEPAPPPKLIQTTKPKITSEPEKNVITPKVTQNEKIVITASPASSKPEVKTLLMNPVSELNKVTTPNILSKSNKLRGAKPMLVIDKATGKQKIIMTKPESAIKEIKPPTQTIVQASPQPAAKTEKFIILPTGGPPRAGRTQRIVIDPSSGKAHVLVAKGQETVSVPENKPVSAKLVPSASDTATPGNTVMIITNAQGAQSRIVLTPEHEKILFPNKAQPNMTQLKTITQRISTNATPTQKIIASGLSPVKAQTKIVPKQQKGAIITSKGQLIVGGRVTSTAQNIAPMPEIRPSPKPENRVPKRIVASEPKKLVQAIQKTTSEPLIFLQQKSGAVMQLTAAQFEHLQRTGQIIHKSAAPAPAENKVVQKTLTISPKEARTPTPSKQRVRKSVTSTSTPPAKKVKQEIAIAPAPTVVVRSVATPPPLTSISHLPPAAVAVPSVSNTISTSTSSAFSDLDNLEELLPSTAIVKQQEPPPAPAPPVEPAAAAAPPEAPGPLADGQLLAVPGENFGGPPGSFYLCVEDNGTLTPIDNRPLMLENNQLVPMAVEPAPVCAPPERQDILQAALANSDVFHAEGARDDAPDFRDLNANVSVHCRVSETSSILNQPIMTPVEVPTKGESEPVPSNLEDGLAVIGVTPHTVPTSLELPITVTDPRIAPKTTDPLSNNNYGTSLLPSPNTEMAFAETEVSGPISMPLLTDDDPSSTGGGGKSMPILTDDVPERGASSVETVCSAEAEGDGVGWARRLLTPHTDLSDASEASAEIPLQSPMQLSAADLSRHT